ncbi:hypothetical protein AKJ09_05723 [Labilithrix luteola]|uniref:DUF1565 domain-containing protein n=2 Tax=Labilithrix luteola TaxID=1391654 RepID=A0A0K1Q0X2_9BACT|nr:hypothetical protein AKJ09_05723 [Labilithrix luteola]
MRHASVLALLLCPTIACGSSDEEGASSIPSAAETPASDAGLGGSNEDAPPKAQLHAVRVSVKGLKGDGLVLENNGQDKLAVSTDGTSTFVIELTAGANYDVTVETQPKNPSQTCTVVDGKGAIESADVSVDVTCTTNQYTVGGTVTGLLGTGLVLHNGAEDLPVSGTTFSFTQKVIDGNAYDVTVTTSPEAPPQECEVTNGSGTVTGKDVTDVTVACVQRYFVDVTVGSDGNTGLRGSPWKTLTHALTAVPEGAVEIMVAPGNYDSAAGETFPLTLKSDVALIGDVPNKGKGAIATLLNGSGNYTFSGGSARAEFGSPNVAVVVPPGVTNAAVRGFDILDSTGMGIAVDDATLTFASMTISNVYSVALFAGNGAQVDVESSVINGGTVALFVCDETTKVRMRNTRVTATNNFGAVTVGFDKSPVTGANMDLGTAASPGGNTLLGGDTGVGLLLYPTSTVVQAVGNTWKANVQGADATGKYAASLVDGAIAVPLVPGNNFGIVTAQPGQGLQF